MNIPIVNFLTILFCVAKLVGGEAKILDSNGSMSQYQPKSAILEKSNLPGVTTWQGPLLAVEAKQEYEASVELLCEELVPGAAISLHLAKIDQQGKVQEVVREGNARFQQIYAKNFPHTLKLRVKTDDETGFLRMELKLGGNPIRVKILGHKLEKYVAKPLFKGVYGQADPMPERQAVIKELDSVKATESWIEYKDGNTFLVLDGSPVPYKAYRGSYDYRLMAENGANLVITHNHGSSLYVRKAWDREASAGDGTFDFTRVEDNLLRIHAANPKLRVILRVGCDPDNQWLEEHPENILLNEKGERGIVRGPSGFKGFGLALNPEQPQERWAWTYASETYQQYVIKGLIALADFLKTSPAGKIIAGFALDGGRDGQFLQWKAGDEEAGHADYSESYQQALRIWLKEKYDSDEELQKAWQDPQVTLSSAKVFSGEEWHSRPYFNSDPGLDRKIIDCRTFLSISTARMLRRFGQTLKEHLGRPCVIQVWYSSPVWRQTSRLSLSELAKGGIDIVAQVTDYAPPRLQGAPGGAANFSIAAANLRKLLYIQELDHRTWRTQEIAIWGYTAYPKDAAEFRAQIIRDAGAALAAGGNGFYYFDMWGTWYNDPEAMAIIRESFQMADWAAQQRGKVPRGEFAVFMDEPDRLHGEGIANGGTAMKSLRLSGLTPDIYMLEDILNPELPEYKLYLFFSPMTITPKQIETIQQRVCQAGKVIMIVGPTGICGPYKAAKPVLAAFGLEIEDRLTPNGNVVAFDEGRKHPLLQNCRGRLGSRGVEIQDDKVSYLHNPVWATITDPEAIVLGHWLGTSEPGLVCKTSEKHTLIYTPQIGGVSPQLLANAAQLAGIKPAAKPGNAVCTGQGIAVGHRLADPIKLSFPRKMNFFDSASREKLGAGTSFKLNCLPGESQAILYEVAD
jgi:beta-galactosidase